MPKKYLLGLLLMFAACADTPPATFHSYTPPLTPGGVMCIDQCRQSHDYCNESCGLDYRSCINDVQATAQQDFDRYAQDRFTAHLPLDRNPSDFEHRDGCKADHKHCLDDCDTPYNSCYNACGGKATAMPACSSFCFE